MPISNDKTNLVYIWSFFSSHENIGCLIILTPMTHFTKVYELIIQIL